MKRRDFLRNITLATAALSLPPALAKAAGARQEPESEIDGIIVHNDSDADARLEKPVTVIVIGAGNRGGKYSQYAALYPGSLSIVGVSDIVDSRKERMGNRFGVDPGHRFGDWSEVFTVPRFADAVIIATPDDVHHGPCMKALEAGYHVLLEKPIAQSERECTDILKQARKHQRIVAVCHVLRYAPYFEALREVIRSGRIGQVVSIQHLEPIGAYHMAHSYVRGNWHNSRKTTPIIVAKSCHDIDILQWITGRRYKEIVASGGLAFFRPENAPAGAAGRCLDCPAERECAFSAKRHYYEQRKRLYVFDLPDEEPGRGEAILDYLRTTDYGRCVFGMDNDQCDHYVMNMVFEDGSTAAFSMEAMTSYEGRRTRIMGTRGDITGDMRSFVCTDFMTGHKSGWKTEIKDGHGGGDLRLVRDFARAVSKNDETLITSSIEASVESHVVGFRAELSRLKRTVEKI